MDATAQAEDAALSAERWVMRSNGLKLQCKCKVRIANAQYFIIDDFP